MDDDPNKIKNNREGCELCKSLSGALFDSYFSLLVVLRDPQIWYVGTRKNH